MCFIVIARSSIHFININLSARPSSHPPVYPFMHSSFTHSNVPILSTHSGVPFLSNHSLIHPLSVIYHHSSTIAHPPSLIHHRSSTIAHPPSLIHHRSSTIPHPPILHSFLSLCPFTHHCTHASILLTSPHTLHSSTLKYLFMQASAAHPPTQ